MHNFGLGKLLLSEPPLQVLPTLAERLGLNEAIILQQIHYLLSYSKNEVEGFRWVFNSFPEWKEKYFRWWGLNTIKRAFTVLEDQGILVARKLNSRTFDKTKWYRIDYEKLGSFLEDETQEEEWGMGLRSTQNGSTIDPDRVEDQPKMGRPIPIDSNKDSNTENKEESTLLKSGGGSGSTKRDKKTDFEKAWEALGEEGHERFNRFWEAYPRNDGKLYAQAAWIKINPDSELLEVILQAIKRAEEKPEWQEGVKFIPMPATWLNGKRWQDQGVNPNFLKKQEAQGRNAKNVRDIHSRPDEFGNLCEG